MTTTQQPLQVTATEVMYEVNGPALRDAINRTGLTQREFSYRLGFNGGSRISHLCAKPKALVRESTIKAIAKILNAHDVSVHGIVNL